MNIQAIWNQINDMKPPNEKIDKNLIYPEIEFGNTQIINDVINTAEQVIMEYQAPKNNPFYRPEIIAKLANIGLLVSQIYDEIFPLQVNTYHGSFIKGVIKTYEDIRLVRYKELVKKNPKTNDKYGMKGLKSAVIVAVILYCTFIFENRPIPAPMLIKYVNTAIDRKGVLKRKVKKGQETIKRKPQTMQKITLQMFDTYRTNDKKGIYKYIKKLAPKCYKNNVKPENFVPFISKTYFKLTEEELKETIKLAKRSVDVFDETKPSGTIALVCILYTMAKNKKLKGMTHQDFGVLSQQQLLTHYKTLINSGIVEKLPLNPFKPTSSML